MSRWIGLAPFGEWYQYIDGPQKMHYRDRRRLTDAGLMIYLGHGLGWELRMKGKT